MINGKRLLELRESHGYSREKLAELIKIGSTQIYRYEKGDSDATAEIVARLAQTFGVTSDYLIGISDNPLGYDQKLSAHELRIINLLRNNSVTDVMKAILETVPSS